MALMAHAVLAFKVLKLLHTGYYWNPREHCREVAPVHRHGAVHFILFPALELIGMGGLQTRMGNIGVSTLQSDEITGETSSTFILSCTKVRLHIISMSVYERLLIDRFSMPECNSLPLSDPHSLNPFLRTLSRPHISPNSYSRQPLNCALSYST